jgi:hypothetical protein
MTAGCRKRIAWQSVLPPEAWWQIVMLHHQ